MNETEYLLSLVAEECAEVAQRAIKAQRFGAFELQEGQDLNNAKRIIYELSDLLTVVKMLQERCVLPSVLFDMETQFTKAKREKIKKYMEYARSCGTLY